MKINPGNSKAVRFTRAQVKDLLNYSLLDQGIRKASNCKCLVTFLCSNLSWTDHVNYTEIKVWKARYFTNRILKEGNGSMKSLAYMSLVCLILEFRAACWDPQQGTDECVRPGAYEGGKICKSNKLMKLGNAGAVQKDSKHTFSL